MEECHLYKNKFRIESTRLRNFDYTMPGTYFVTICTKERESIFGEIRNGIMGLSEQGCIAYKCWQDLPKHYPNCILDQFIVMPDHVHMITKIIDFVNDGYNENGVLVETGLKPVSTTTVTTAFGSMATDKPMHGLSEIIRGFKTFSARKINDYQRSMGKPIWQPRFYDHIVRNEIEYDRIRGYIMDNPRRWWINNGGLM